MYSILYNYYKFVIIRVLSLSVNLIHIYFYQNIRSNDSKLEKKILDANCTMYMYN